MPQNSVFTSGRKRAILITEPQPCSERITGFGEMQSQGTCRTPGGPTSEGTSLGPHAPPTLQSPAPTRVGHSATIERVPNQEKHALS